MKNKFGEKIGIWQTIIIIGIISILTLLFLPSISAQPVFEINKDIELNLPCTIDGIACSDDAYCSVTIINPIGEVLLNNVNMTKDGAVFKINLYANQTTNGEYEFNVNCCDNGNCQSKFLTFWITPNGEIATSGKAFLYIGLLVMLVIFMILSIYYGINADVVYIKGGLLLLAYLFLIGITFVSWNLSADYLTSAPFITAFFRILWWITLVAFLPLLLFMVIYCLYMMFKIKEIQKLVDKGIPIDEAYERNVRRGQRSVGIW